MDNKRFFGVIMVCLPIFLGWLWVNHYVQMKYPQPVSPTLAEETVAATSQAAGQAPGTAPAATQPSSGGAPAGLAAVSAPKPVSVTLGSTDPASKDYTVGLELTSTGAGVESVTLNRFKAFVNLPDRYVFQRPSEIAPDMSRVLSTQTVVVDGKAIDVKGANWTLARSDVNSAVFTLDLARDGAPVVRLTKTIKVSGASTPEGKDSPSGGYEVTVEFAYANLSAAAVQTSATFNGPNIPPYEIERGPERQVVHAYLSQSNRQVLLRRTMVESFSASKREIDMTKDDGEAPSPLGWIGGSGAYFNALIELDAPGSLARASAVVLNPEQTDGHLRDVVLPLQTAAITLSPGQASTQAFSAFFGPKKRSLLEDAYYSAYPRNYDATLITTSWLCSFCTFQWLIGLLVGLLNVFHWVVRDWGVAIILLVCVVRLVLHPVTRRSQESMKKMAKLQEPLQALKKKYANDKEAYNKAQMEFMRENGGGQLLGCLPMFLQTPIWLALYAGLQSTFELRQQPFFYGWTWIHDLAKPDHLFAFAPFSLPLIGTISGLNIIPFALGLVFFFQYKLTPRPAASTPEQEQQQKMMQWMTLIMPIFLYSAPAGLNIYILTSTTFGIVESKMIRDRIDRQEKLIAEGKIVVKKKEPKTGGIMKLFADLQERAEKMRNAADKKS